MIAFELTALWSVQFKARYRKVPKNASEAAKSRIEGARTQAIALCDAVSAEMGRRQDAYVEQAGAMLDTIPNPYEGYANGLYEYFRAGAAAYIVGVSREDAMAMHGLWFRQGWLDARQYMVTGVAPPRVGEFMQHEEDRRRADNVIADEEELPY